ncbi:MAG: hypothetical protein ACHQ2Z_03435 [Elusimicrobiota bacterium]
MNEVEAVAKVEGAEQGEDQVAGEPLIVECDVVVEPDDQPAPARFIAPPPVVQAKIVTAFTIAVDTLELGLRRLRPTWATSEIGANHEFIRFEISGHHLRLTAANISITTSLRVPLYETAAAQGTFHLFAREVLNIVNVASGLLTFIVDEKDSCTIKMDGGSWPLRSIRELKLGDTFKDTGSPGVQPLTLLREPFLQGLRVCAPCMGRDESAANMCGIKFQRDSIRSTDAQRIAVFRMGAATEPFTVPAQMIPALEKLLERQGFEIIGLRINPHQVEVSIGDEARVMFSQMGAVVDLDPVLADLNVCTPMFQADRDSLLLYLERSRSGVPDSKKRALVTLSRVKDDLFFTVKQNDKKIFEGGFRVTWLTPDTGFSLVVNCKALIGLIGGLDGHRVKLGLGDFRGHSFIRIDEDDRSLFMLNVAG